MDALKEVKEIIQSNLPKETQITNIEMEGPEVAIYTRNPKAFFENENFVAKIAFELKKRVNIRTDKSLLSDEMHAKKVIQELVPESAEIKEIYFNPAFSEVVIDAIKPGLVIGKGGETSKEIILKTGWTPNILRSPTSESEILKGIRHHLHKYSSERKKILNETAKKIYREKNKNNGWVRLTALGGFREVGKSCLMIETPETKVLLDVGVDVANIEQPYPYLEAIRFPLDQLDGVVISHAHLDHSGLIPLLFKMGYRGPVYCSVDYEEQVMIKEDGVIKTEKIGKVIDSIIDESKEKEELPYNEFIAAKPERNIEVPCFSKKDYKVRFKKVKEVIRHSVDDDLFEITAKTGRKVKVTGSHSVFVLKNGKIKEIKVNELSEGDQLVVPQKIPTQETKLINLKGKMNENKYLFKNGKIKTKQSKGIPQVLEVNKELLRILGYFASEGHIEKRAVRFTFGLKEEEIVKELKNCIKTVFGLEAKEAVKNRNTISVSVNSIVVRDLFKNYFFKEYKKATSKHVPEIVFNVSNELKMQFVDAYFKGDGTVNLLNKTAHAISVSERLVSDISYVLTQLGINYTLFSRHVVSAKTKNIAHRITLNLSDFGGTKRLDKKSTEIIPLKETNFNKEWYYHRLKERKSVTKERLKALIDKGWIVNTKGSTYSIQENLSKLAESDLSFLPITKIKKVEASNGHVYDFSVDEDENFVGGNAPICLHNTKPTRDLMALLQFDYIDVLIKEGKEPPYTERDVKEMLKYCITREYREVTDIAPDMRITLHNASHILGSASVHFHIGEGAHNLVYSGDIKFGFTRLFNNVDINYPRLETLIIESTYGGKDDIQQDRNKAEEQLIRILKETMHKGGNTLIPVFSVGRAQEIMLVIEEYYRKGMLDGKVFVDGMTKEASAIHTAYPEYLRKGVQRRVLQNDSPFTSELFQTANAKERDKILEEKEAIIIASSGMLTGGPSVQYFQKMAENPKNTMVFVGYQGEGSLGNRIQKGLKKTPISDNGKTRELPINMRVETVEGFSGHSDRNQLVNYIRNLNPKPKKIIVNHGEKDTAIEFARYVSNKFRINSNAIRDLDAVRLK